MGPALIEFGKPIEVTIKMKGEKEAIEKTVETLVLDIGDVMDIQSGEMRTTFTVARRGWFGRENLCVRRDYVQDPSLLNVDGTAQRFAPEVCALTESLSRKRTGGYLHGGTNFKLSYVKG